MKKAIIIISILAMASLAMAIDMTDRPMSNAQQYSTLVSYHQARANYALSLCNLAATTCVMAMMANDSSTYYDAVDNMEEAADIAISEAGYADYYMSLISFTALSKERVAQDEVNNRLKIIMEQIRALK